MSIHHVQVTPDTAATLHAAKPDSMALLVCEAAILTWWAERWQRATPHKRQKFMDSLMAVIAEGQQHG